MNTAVMLLRIAETSPRFKARTAGLHCLLIGILILRSSFLPRFVVAI